MTSILLNQKAEGKQEYGCLIRSVRVTSAHSCRLPGTGGRHREIFPTLRRWFPPARLRRLPAGTGGDPSGICPRLCALCPGQAARRHTARSRQPDTGSQATKEPARGGRPTRRLYEQSRKPTPSTIVLCPCRGIVRSGSWPATAENKVSHASTRFEYPIRYTSTSCAHLRPSVTAQTTRDWPRCMSPAVNTCGTFVE